MFIYKSTACRVTIIYEEAGFCLCAPHPLSRLISASPDIQFKVAWIRKEDIEEIKNDI